MESDELQSWTSIEASFHEAEHDPTAVYCKGRGRRVLKSERKVVKHGVGIDLQEAKNLSFIAKSELDVFAPKLLRAGQTDGVPFIETEYIPGTSLEEIWKELSKDEKENYARQLCQIVSRLRLREANYIGGFDEGPACDNQRDTEKGGPFASEADFNEFL